MKKAVPFSAFNSSNATIKSPLLSLSHDAISISKKIKKSLDKSDGFCFRWTGQYHQQPEYPLCDSLERLEIHKYPQLTTSTADPPPLGPDPGRGPDFPVPPMPPPPIPDIPLKPPRNPSPKPPDEVPPPKKVPPPQYPPGWTPPVPPYSEYHQQPEYPLCDSLERLEIHKYPQLTTTTADPPPLGPDPGRGPDFPVPPMPPPPIPALHLVI